MGSLKYVRRGLAFCYYKQPDICSSVFGEIQGANAAHFSTTPSNVDQLAKKNSGRGMDVGSVDKLFLRNQLMTPMLRSAS